MRKWEYLTEVINTKGVIDSKIEAAEFNKALNTLGKEGWELIDKTALAAEAGRTTSIVCVFKRELA
jgi:hypothetical protein